MLGMSSARGSPGWTWGGGGHSVGGRQQSHRSARRGIRALDTELLDVVGMIYDAVIEPSRWESVIETIRVPHGWHNASMSVITPTTQRMVILNLALNVPENFFEEAPRHVDDVVAMWGGPGAGLPSCRWRSRCCSPASPTPATWMDNTYFRTWAHPRDRRSGGDGAGTGFDDARQYRVQPSQVPGQRPPRRRWRNCAYWRRICAGRRRSAGSLSARQRVPRRSRRRSMRRVRARCWCAATWRSCACERHRRDHAAERRSDPVERWPVRLINELVPGHLETAVQAAAEGAAAIGRRGIGIPARRRDGSPLVTHVMPLEARLGTRSSADAVVFLADGGAEPLPTDRLSLLFGLTPAETRVFEMAASGSSPDQMAERLADAEHGADTSAARLRKDRASPAGRTRRPRSGTQAAALTALPPSRAASRAKRPCCAIHASYSR